MTGVVATVRGTVTAVAFFLDPELIGVHEAQQRVLARWQDGCRLLHALDGWLLVLAQPEEVRTAHAPGQPIEACPNSSGTLRIARSGVEHAVHPDELEPVAMTGWLGRDALAEHRLTVCDGPVPAPDVVPAPPVELPDLRVVAGLTGAAPRVDQMLGRAPSPASRRIAGAVLLVLLLALVAGVIWLLHDSGSSGGTRRGASSAATATPGISSTPAPTVTTVVIGGRTALIPLPSVPTFDAPKAPRGSGTSIGTLWAYALLFAAAIWLWRQVRRGWQQGRAQRAQRAQGGAPARRARTRSGLLSRLLPGAQGVVGRRQARYLNDLTGRFQQGDFDGALRRAIGLGSGRGGAMSLRLPKPRQQLSFGATSAGGGTFYGENVYLHLLGLYRSAAQDLEAKGRIAEAAFVHGELLKDTAAAVAVLERGGLTRTAAELATARELDPALLVRLWWRAGDRRRALDVARSRGAFAAGIERLEKVDEAAAAELRGAWVETALAGGDLDQAFEGAWPDVQLRDVVARTALEQTVDLDALRPPLLARVVVATGDATAVAAADRLLAGAGDEQSRPARAEFVATLAGLDGSVDATADRRLCSESLLTLLRDGGTPATINAKQARRLVNDLSARADPLLLADLPPVPRGRAPVVDGAPALHLVAAAGATAVRDAAVLPDRRLLLALGTRGTALLSPGGAVAHRWDRPVDRIVLADNGAGALLVHATGIRAEVTRLDLVTLRTTAVGTIAARIVPDSFDGGILTVVDDRGIALLDVLSGAPRELWRELSAGEAVLALGRTPDSLAALVRTADGDHQLCRWSLPDMIMRLRNRVQLGHATTAAAVVPNHVWSVDHASPLGTRLRRSSYWKPAETDRTAIEQSAVLGSSGALAALCEPHADGTTSVTVLDAEAAVQDAPVVALTAECGELDSTGLRSTGNLIVVWSDGAVVAYDRTAGEVVASTGLGS